MCKCAKALIKIVSMKIRERRFSTPFDFVSCADYTSIKTLQEAPTLILHKAIIGLAVYIMRLSTGLHSGVVSGGQQTL